MPERRGSIAVDRAAAHFDRIDLADVFARLGVAFQDREPVQPDFIDALPAVLGGLAELGAAFEPMNTESHAFESADVRVLVPDLRDLGVCLAAQLERGQNG